MKGVDKLSISTHAPYTEGDFRLIYYTHKPFISTHAPYTEGDQLHAYWPSFLLISTHAPYTEGDRISSGVIAGNPAFQLTPPIQRATNLFGKAITKCLFQLTPPIQRATLGITQNGYRKGISTHAPYTEGDLLA